jgi:hypothetical protein
MDVTVTRVNDGSTWTLTDLLGRSMGQVTERQAGAFWIEPKGGAVETMAGLKQGPHPSLDLALAEIETHTRGVCRLAPEASGTPPPEATE